MPTTTIGGMTDAGALTSATLIEVENAGVSGKAPLSNVPIAANQSTALAAGLLYSNSTTIQSDASSTTDGAGAWSIVALSTSGNVTVGNRLTATGNVTGGNLITAGVVVAVGNITGNFFQGNGSQLTGISATSLNANASTNMAAGALYSNGTALKSDPATTTDGAGTWSLVALSASTTLTSTGNGTFGNVTTAGRILATGNITGGNLATAGTATLANVSVTGNEVVAGNHTAARYFGDGGNLTGVTATVNITTATDTDLTGLLYGNGTKVGTAPGLSLDANGNLTANRLTANLSITANASTAVTLGIGSNSGVLELGNASAITLTLPNSLPAGFNCLVVQTGAGNITFANDTGATLHNRQGHANTAGQWAECSLYVSSNANGTAAVYVLAGDTQT